LLAACSSTKFLFANVPTVFSGIDRHLDLPYGPDPRQRLDLYEPRKAATGSVSDAQGPRPVVIFWYGGSWTEGTKERYRFVGTTLAQKGFVAVLPDYRLYPQAAFPVFEEDGARAVAWVEQHAQEFGGDPHHIVLMGHSAGAHTAAFLAFNHAFLQKYGGDPRSISGLVGLSGPYALVPDTDVLHATFPAPYTESDWQPIHFVDANAPPTLLLHGVDDKDVWSRQAVELRDALLRNHRQVELRLYPHRGHADTVAPFALIVRWRTPAVDDTVAFIESVTRSR
jgi:acetyl esterase/lipase